MRKETKKHRQKVVDDTIQSAVNGWQIPMMKVSEIHAAGQSVADASPTIPIEMLTDVIRASVTDKLQEVATIGYTQPSDPTYQPIKSLLG